jgi:hypothetical protein
MKFREIIRNVWDAAGAPAFVMLCLGLVAVGWGGSVLWTITHPSGPKTVVIEKVAGPYNREYDIFDALKDFPNLQKWRLYFNSDNSYRNAPFDITITTDKEEYSLLYRHFDKLVEDINSLKRYKLTK